MGMVLFARVYKTENTEEMAIAVAIPFHDYCERENELCEEHGDDYSQHDLWADIMPSLTSWEYDRARTIRIRQCPEWLANKFMNLNTPDSKFESGVEAYDYLKRSGIRFNSI